MLQPAEAASLITQGFLELQGLNPPPREVPGADDTHERVWLQTMLADWNPMVANFAIVAQELRQHNASSTEYKFALLNKTISKLQGVLQETDTKLQLVVSMIGDAPWHAYSTASVWRLLGVEGGFKEMKESHKMEKATSNKLIDLAMNSNNLANSYSENCRAIEDKLNALEQEGREMGPGVASRGSSWNGLERD